MKTKKTYVAPTLLVHGDVGKITSGSKFAFEDAWFGVSGTDGIVGPKCKPGDQAEHWWEACGS